MVVEKLLTLLLPLGAWLILSSSSPRAHESRYAASGLLALAISTLAFFGVGYAFMFGGIGTVTNLPAFSRFVTYYSVPIDAQNWGIIGLRGFLLADAAHPVAMDLFIVYLPIIITGAVILASLMTPQSKSASQSIAVLFLSAIIIPVIGFWMWGGGWLSALGVNLSLGHGATDFGGLTTIALACGGAGLAWLISTPRQQVAPTENAPHITSPAKAMIGAFSLLIGAACFISSNPLYDFGNAAASTALTNYLLASSVSVLLIYGYTIFVARKPDLSISTRGVIAATIAMSAGGIILPYSVGIIVGVITAILVIAGLHLTNHIQRRHDEVGIFGTVLGPAILGMLVTGLFATGAYGQGWNGIGLQEYLGVANLGVVGALPLTNTTADPGQFTAQLAATGVIVLASALLFAPVAFMLPRSRIQEAESIAITEPVSVHEKAKMQEHIQEQQSEPARESLQTSPQASVSVPDLATDTGASQAPPRESLLDRLRKARVARDEPEPPSQARHVAYPNRIGGRRFAIRPVTKNGKSETAEDTPE